MELTTQKFVSLMASCAIALGSIAVAHAQDNVASATTASQQKNATPTAVARKAREQARAERKAARKQARTQRRAEMKKLEDAGYKPGANDPNYPNSLQDAQRKAGTDKAASQ
ncbi:hypothetical protein [Burkholderia territorii]|uniref:hypothetical protein n=1 Tax=Burkholderia territorii TaxID=1503055 RepID=UPI00075EA750|nr:hypothetical protein [Burkholderia territorii]KVQ62994.1 hypothetical protein WT23_17565 [Burkholderia territorii]